MSATCKFCPLIDTSNVSSVSYQMIIEALMQVAISLTSKNNIGKDVLYTCLNKTPASYMYFYTV